MKLHINNREFKSKEAVSKFVGLISNEIVDDKVDVSVEELADSMGKGKTVLLGLHNGVRSKRHFISQEVVALDIDDTGMGIDLEYLQNDQFLMDNAAFIYETLSSTKENPRFRVVFILEEVITNYKIVEYIYNELFDLFPYADSVVKDTSRLFFGGKNITVIDYNQKLALDNVNVDSKLIDTLDEELEKELEQEKEAEIKTSVEKLPEIEKENLTEFDEKPPHIVEFDPKRYFLGKKTWELFKEGYLEEVKDRLQPYSSPVEVADLSAAMSYLVKVDMGFILGIDSEEQFSDILGNDKNPSCKIWYSDESQTWLYTRYSQVSKNGNYKTYNIISLLSKLMGKNMMYVINVLADILNVEIGTTQELQTMRNEIDIFKSIILAPDFKEVYPDLYKIVGRNRYQAPMNAILDIFKNSIYKDKETGEYRNLTWMSEKNISKRIGESEAKTKRILTLMTSILMIDKLGDNEIPENLVEKLNESKKRNRVNRRSSVYEVRKIMSNFEDIEDRATELVEKGFTMRSLSRNYFLTNFGEEEANRIYPQNIDVAKGNDLGSVNYDYYKMIELYILENVSSKGYVKIQDLKDYLYLETERKTYSDNKVAELLNGILDSYSLKKVKSSKEMIEELGIEVANSRQRPYIIVYN